MIPPPDALPDDPATLKEIILAQRAEALRMAASVRAYGKMAHSRGTSRR